MRIDGDFSPGAPITAVSPLIPTAAPKLASFEPVYPVPQINDGVEQSLVRYLNGMVLPWVYSQTIPSCQPTS